MERRYGSLHRQTGRQGNGSFFALTHAWLNLHFFSLSLSLPLSSLWLAGRWCCTIFQALHSERERELCALSVPLCWQATRGGKEQFQHFDWYLFSAVLFLLLLLFSSFLRRYTRLLLYQTPAGSIAPTVTSPPGTTTASLSTAVTLYLSRCRRLECTSSVSPPDRVCQ